MSGLTTSAAAARRALVVRLDNAGDVLLAGPAVRAVAAALPVTVLAGPAGAAAARLLPGVDDVVVFEAPWILADPPAVRSKDLDALVRVLRQRRFDIALVLTSARQSALPMALLLRQAGVPCIAAVSHEYPGSLLDVRIKGDPDVHEARRALLVAEAAGFGLPEGDDGRLRVRRTPLDPVLAGLLPSRYVVVHPGSSAAARTWPPARWADAVAALVAEGHDVVVTGSADEDAGGLVRGAAGLRAVDLVGRTTLAELAEVVAGASTVCCGNTGVLHLAAAVGTPVAAIFPPTVPRHRWAPWLVPHVLLGDAGVPCAPCYQRECPLDGHPCSAVAVDELLDAVALLAGAAEVRA